MAKQRPERSEGRGGTGYPASIVVPLGESPAGPEGRPGCARSAQPGGDRGGEPSIAGGKREAARATRDPKKITGHPLRNAAARYARIEVMSGEHTVAVLCQTLTVSRSGYYAWRTSRDRPSARARENRALTQQIRTVFTANRQSYGSPRIARALQCPGKRNRIARLMHQAGIWARQRSKYRVVTTRSDHGG